MVPFSSIGVRKFVRATLVLAIKPFAGVACLICLSFRWLQDGVQNLVDIIWGCLWLDFELLLELGWQLGIRLGRLYQFLTNFFWLSLSWDVSILIKTHGDNLVRWLVLSFLFWFLDGLVLDWFLGRGTLLVGRYQWLCFSHENFWYISNKMFIILN